MLGLWTAAVLVCISRVYLEYHSASQVWVGAAVGCSVACLWAAAARLLFRLGAWCMRLGLDDVLWIRDTRAVPHLNVAVMQWTRSFAERGANRKSR